MRSHQIAAIIGAVFLAALSFAPLVITYKSGYDLAHPEIVSVFWFPIAGLALAIMIVVISLFQRHSRQ